MKPLSGEAVKKYLHSDGLLMALVTMNVSVHPWGTFVFFFLYLFCPLTVQSALLEFGKSSFDQTLYDPCLFPLDGMFLLFEHLYFLSGKQPSV